MSTLKKSRLMHLGKALFLEVALAFVIEFIIGWGGGRGAGRGGM